MRTFFDDELDEEHSLVTSLMRSHFWRISSSSTTCICSLHA